MRIRIATALFVLLSLCSIVSMRPGPETRPMFGGNPIPCWPPGNVSPCLVQK